ncbi:hypothetical protein [Glycomyces tritici]|uniref:Uncharacterized protein n=1 Tax=Glycomyces tritici TaxID=2665176 RepID=A0ABT7YWM8_9ACTN|nr:hypothetical protein [Glycomyces tritici]MDN3243023.1 hypothetical protein [Glycomyces tritici]
MLSAINVDLAALTVSVLGVLVAVLGIMAASRPPRRHLRIVAFPPQPLLRNKPLDLHITIAGQDLIDPYVTELAVRSTGRFDFTEANTPDGGNVGVYFSRNIRVNGFSQVHWSYRDDENVDHIAFEPHKLTRNQQLHRVWVLTEGRPKVTLNADALIDATARLHQAPWRKVRTRRGP